MPTVTFPLSKVVQTRESCLRPVCRKSGLCYEARRRLPAAPGAQKLSTVILLKDDTQVYKQFVENESFRRFVTDMVFTMTSG